jgi:hypothetical protein
MEFEDGGGIFELAALVMAAVELDIAELIERLLELASEAGAIQCEAGEEPMGVHDIEINGGLLCWRVGGALEHVGFEERDAIEAPGCVGELLDHLGFGWGCGLILIHELAAVLLVCGRVL